MPFRFFESQGNVGFKWTHLKLGIRRKKKKKKKERE